MKPFEIGQTGLLKTVLDDPVILSGRFWDELRVFLAVAKLGSFAKAGTYLGLSTATVSRHVRRLQDQLRSQLIISGRTGSKLTPDGSSLAKALAELDHKVFSIANNFRTNTRQVEGTVRISATEGLAGVFIAAKLADFYRSYPGVTIHLKTPINVTSLRENRADIMIGFEKITASDIKCIPIGFLHLIPIASQKYLRAHGRPTATTVEQHIFVDSQYYQAKTGMWAHWQEVTARGRVAADCDSSLAHAMAVIGGLGIGLLGNYVLSDEMLQPVDLDIHVAVPMYLIGLVERMDARPVRVVMDWLTETFGPTNPWFADDLNLRADEPTAFLTAMRALQGAASDGVR
jgi:DNA-binding transcriptional LysR family regulator